VMRHTSGDRHGWRLRGLIVVLWRAGLRIQEALALAEHDLDPRRGSLLARNGKGGRRREVAMDEWGWDQLRRWLNARLELPVGPLFCIIDGPTRGRPWSGAAVGSEFRRTHALELAREGVPLNIIQRQLGHANLGTTLDPPARDRPRGDHHGCAHAPRADDVRERRAAALIESDGQCQRVRHDAPALPWRSGRLDGLAETIAPRPTQQRRAGSRHAAQFCDVPGLRWPGGDRQLAPPLRLLAVQAQHRWRRRLPWIVGGLGVAALCGGVLVLFTTNHDARSAFLLTLGAALVLIARLGGQIQLEGFEILGAKVRVREVIKSRLELAESAERAGDEDGTTPHQQALVLQKLNRLYGLYEHIRRVEPPGPRRTEALDQLAARMQQAGGEADFDAAEVIGWFHDGTDPLRIIALNLMQANEDYRDFLAVLETVDSPHSLFEQFYGLRLAEAMLPKLDPLERRLLSDAIARARRKRWFRRDPPLMSLSRRILEQLDDST
jgi:hypothetical protein